MVLNHPYLFFYLPVLLAATGFNLFFLIPRLLERGRYKAYFATLTGTIVIASAAIVSEYYLSARFTHHTVEELYGVSICYYYFFGTALPVVFGCLIITTCIKLTKEWITIRRKEQKLEKDKIESELNFLKHQFNPHFLFNTINLIFFLIHKKPDTASESLARFSNLLRYQLYECNDRQILLTKEIDYLKNMIELEKLRQNDNVRIGLELDMHHNPTGELPTIAPFILMTFVENAFKHVSKESGTANWITIKIALEQDQLNFSVANSISTGSFGKVIHNSGIGLKNVRRRLDLLYRDRYDLNILSDSTCFEARLNLQLSPGATTVIHTAAPAPALQNKNFDYLAS